MIFFTMLLPAYADSQMKPTDKGTLQVELSTEPETLQSKEEAKVKINFINPNKEEVQEHIDYRVTISKDDKDVFGPTSLIHTAEGTATIPFTFPEKGKYTVLVEVEGILFQPIPLEKATFELPVGMQSNQVDKSEDVNGQSNGAEGGCLIATAAYGSELAPEVQQLRELREDTVMRTESGSSFMQIFNNAYYAVSPTIADYERENEIFRDSIRILITPMVKSLALLNFVEVDSEAEMIMYGSSIILLNIGMYIGIPAFGIFKLYKFRNDKW